MARETHNRVELALTASALANLPIRERIADRLADALFDIDEVVEMLSGTDVNEVRWIEPEVRVIYDRIDDLMRKVCD